MTCDLIVVGMDGCGHAYIDLSVFERLDKNHWCIIEIGYLYERSL